jgi:hypothetical protein
MNTTIIMDLIVCVFLLIIFRLVLRVPKSRAKENSSVTVRLSRVRNASLVFFILLCLGMILGVYWILGFIFGWPFFAEDHIRMVISHNHIYSSRSEMPTEIFWLMIVKQGLAFFAGGVMLRLFWLYGKGILFTAKNVNCLRFLGYYFIIDWFINYRMQGVLRDLDLSTTPIFVGFFIIFFAWIMDEGRKIQEEQELTV